MPNSSAAELITRVLPAIAVVLWCAIYVIYFWRDPGFRRWLERQAYQLTRDGRRRVPVRPPPPVIFRTAPKPLVPRPRLDAPVRPPPPAALPSPLIPRWQAADLPLRYRLLGQVRPASNDND